MRIIVGISGASGVVLGQQMLAALRIQPDMEIHLVISDHAKQTLALESALPLSALTALADKVHDDHNQGSAIASGSFHTDGMIIIPCSMKTVAAIVTGYSDNLLVRAADVCLKEHRKLVLCPREMPLSRIHLRNLSQAADFGCIIIPPMLTMYNQADTLQKQMDHIIGKILHQFDLNSPNFVPWQGRD
ncbi:MAG: UbiX family flavin prenyltransferase [Clostridiales bacterium]